MNVATILVRTLGVPQGSRTVPRIIVEVPEPERVRALAGKPFLLHHNLAHAPMLSLSEVRRLATRMLDERRVDQVACVGGRATPGSSLGGVERLHAAVDALESIEMAGAWLRLTRIDEVNDDLRGVSEQFIADLSELYGSDIGSQVLKTFMTLFISSPGAITPYHMDHTWNFLLQVEGRKTVHLFDGDDPQVLTIPEKECWYMERPPPIQLRADAAGIPYDLQPGDAAHHPINAPHWVQNGAEVSISLSLGMCLRDSIRYARVHQVNYMLRGLGLRPAPPGRSRVKDGLKSAMLGAVSRQGSTRFDDMVFSGKRRVDRLLKMGGIKL